MRKAAARDFRARKLGLSRLTVAKRDILLLIIIAFAIRLACVRWGAWEANDAVVYLILARNVVFHHIFSMDTGPGPLFPAGNRPPFYPLLIAALWWRDAAPITTVLLLQATLGTATVACVYLIARDRFNRAVAMIAGVGMAFAPMTCRFTGVLLTETVFTFLLTLGVLLWGRGRYILTGIAFGLGALTRPTTLPFVLALPLVALLPAWRPHWRAHVTITVVAVLISSVWIARNAIVLGKFVPVSASGWGVNLLQGTLDTDVSGRGWTGSEWAVVDIETHPVLRVDETSDYVEKDRVRMRRAWQRIADDPLRWIIARAKQYPRLILDDGAYALGDYNLPIIEALSEPRPLVVLTKTLFVLGNLIGFALAVYGTFVERARFTSLGHIALYPIFLLIIHLPTWIEPRYTLPAMPLMAILTAVGGLRLVEVLRNRWRERMSFRPISFFRGS